jgi:hypothetical protein
MKNKFTKILVVMIVILQVTILNLPTNANNDNLSELVIPIRFKYDIDTEGLEQGNAIPLEITQDVYINGKKLFNENGSGYATIDEFKKAGFFGRGGKIKITQGQLTDINGKSHKVILNANSKGDYKISSPAGALTSAGLAYEIAEAGIYSATATGAILGVGVILIPVAYLFRKGSEAKLASGKIMFAHVLES